MIEIFKEMPTKPKIFLAVPPPVYSPFMDVAFYGINTDITNGKLSKVITKIAHKTGAKVIDVFGEMGGKSLNKPDLFIDKSRPLIFPNDGQSVSTPTHHSPTHHSLTHTHL